MYKNSFVHYLTKIMVDIMFYGGILCCIMVPFLVKRAGGYFGYGESEIIPLTITLLGSGVAAVYIMFNLKLMFKTLLGGNPFVWSNVSCFRKIAVASFIIAMIYTAKCFFLLTIATALIVIIFVIAGLFCLTLKDIFKQAIYYKEENDFTV
jgi:hypothetical protein